MKLFLLKFSSLLLLICPVSSIQMLLAQDLAVLNQYKYAIVETLIDDEMNVDKYQVSTRVRMAFIDKGFIVVNENKQTWPAELFNDPCQGVFCAIKTSAGFMSKYTVDISLTDCNGDDLHDFRGKGSGRTNMEAFQNATEDALLPLFKFHYSYEASPTTDRKVSLKRTSMLPGVYTSTAMNNKLTIDIHEAGDYFEASIRESESDQLPKGFVIGKFTVSGIDESIFNVQWSWKTGQALKGLAKLEEGYRLLIEIEEENRTLVFRKL